MVVGPGYGRHLEDLEGSAPAQRRPEGRRELRQGRSSDHPRLRRRRTRETGPAGGEGEEEEVKLVAALLTLALLASCSKKDETKGGAASSTTTTMTSEKLGKAPVGDLSDAPVPPGEAAPEE